MKKGKIISFFIAIFMIITSLPIRVYAQQNPSLTVTAVKENEEPCSNIYFSIFLNNQLIKKEKTDSSGKVVFSNLERGKYKLVQNTAPDGYEISDIRTVDLTNGQNKEEKYKLAKIKATIILTVTDEQKKALEGVKFVLQGSEDSQVNLEKTTNSEGKAVFNGNIGAGTYKLKQKEKFLNYIKASEMDVKVEENKVKEISLTLKKDSIKVDRIFGKNRIETSIEISKATYEKSGTVILANANNFPDGLVAAPLASKYKAPILLTDKESLTEELLNEIERLEAKNVFILGGINAISKEIEEFLEIKKLKFVKRIEGLDRYETAAEVGKYFVGGEKKVETVILCNGNNFADALAVSSAAVTQKLPILLTPANWLSKATIKVLNNWKVQNVIIIGGETVVSKEIEKALKSAGITTIRVFGLNRHETSIEVAKHFFKNINKAVLATGLNFADALSGGVFAASKNAPIILSDKDVLVDDLAKYLKDSKNVDQVYILGGVNSISDTIKKEIEKLR